MPSTTRRRLPVYGRPPVPSDRRLTEPVRTFLAPSMAEALDVAAAREGKHRAVLLRDLIQDYLAGAR